MAKYDLQGPLNDDLVRLMHDVLPSRFLAVVARHERVVRGLAELLIKAASSGRVVYQPAARRAPPDSAAASSGTPQPAQAATPPPQSLRPNRAPPRSFSGKVRDNPDL